MSAEKKLVYYNFSAYGSISDYPWVSFYEYFSKIKVIDNLKFNKFKDFINSGIYDCIQLDGLCIVSVLPSNIQYIEINGEKKLHCMEKMAISWKDGYGLYALYGVFFDEKLWRKICQEEISFSEVMKIENIEQRYAALRCLGPEKIVKESSAVLKDKSERGNELYTLNIDGIDTVFLKYKCPSTERVYMKFVPPEYKDKKADEAQAWSFGLSLKEYQEIKKES